MASSATGAVRYGESSLADMLPSALAALGVAGEPNVLAIEPAECVVVLLVDGLGWQLLRAHSDDAPFLSSLAARPLTAVGEFRPRRLQLHEHVMGRAEQQVALLGQDEAAGVAVEQRHRKFLLERADLAGDGRLRQAELFAGMREASSFRCGVKHLQLVPIHVGKSVA